MLLKVERHNYPELEQSEEQAQTVYENMENDDYGRLDKIILNSQRNKEDRRSWQIN